eukprot:7902967-Pyramimonas_sp.AAC.1
MTRAMNPEPPKKITDAVARLEEWSALAENLEQYGKYYSLPLPFKVTALRAIVVHANDWFDEWQQACWRTPGALNVDSFQKLYSKCEDWA